MNPDKEDRVGQMLDRLYLAEPKAVVRPSPKIGEAKHQLYELVMGVIGEDEPGKTTFDLGSEFSTPRDYRRNATNRLRAELRQTFGELFGVNQ